MRAVIDTNVFVTALLRGTVPRRIYDAFLDGEFTPVFSPETLAELLEVLTRPALQALMSQTEVQTFLDTIQHDTLLVRPRRHVRACRDPKDDIFLDSAIAGRADCIVTGDRDLLALDPFRDIRILRPAEFLRHLA